DWAYYVQLEGKVGPLGFKGNYRAIDPQYANGVAGMSSSHLAYYGGVTGRQSPAPFSHDQEGVRVDLTAALGPINIEAYVDSYGKYPYNPGTITTDGGVAASLGLPAAFSLKVAYDTSFSGASYFNLTNQTASTVTGTLSHNGGAKDALIRDLDLTLRGTYNTIGQTFGLAAFGTYKLGLGPISLDRILFRYNEPDFNVLNNETLKGGVQASIDLGQLGLPLKPRLLGEAAGRQTGNTTEVKLAGGIAFGEFLFPGSTLEARYAQYRAENVASVAVGVDDHAFAADQNRLYSDSGTAAGTLAGFNVTWRYYDFRVDYGEYLLERTAPSGNTGTDHARTFRVTYTVRF
ncbi:MAG: S-layer protein, partial [Anaerolineae bacterium]|nr:S-layer protein [Anaerolineae bacterium]